MMPLTDGVAPLKKGGMPDCGDGGGLRVMRVGEHGALLEQSRQAAGVVVAKPLQVVVAELIDDDGHYQLGPLGCALAERQ